jgi:HxlR-like helix-turn-helix
VAVNRKCYTRHVTRRLDQPRSGCAINAAVEVIGDRWSLLVLRDVMFGNRRHFRVLQERSEEGIASNILADRLRRLVADGAAPGAAGLPGAAGQRPQFSRRSGVTPGHDALLAQALCRAC